MFSSSLNILNNDVFGIQQFINLAVPKIMTPPSIITECTIVK